MLTDEKDRGITSSDRNFLFNRLTISREFHAHHGARCLTMRLDDIPIGRNGEGKRLTQSGDRSHDRLRTHRRHFDSDG